MSSSDVVILYLFGRTDLVSMNPGKMGAHVAHATYLFARDMQSLRQSAGKESEARDTRLDLLTEWEAQAPQGFGTKITLACNEAQMKAAVMVAQALGFAANVCHDPEYPIMDGAVLHLIPLDTSGYVFGRKKALEPVLGQFKLYP